jgi:hypothetical protein
MLVDDVLCLWDSVNLNPYAWGIEKSALKDQEVTGTDASSHAVTTSPGECVPPITSKPDVHHLLCHSVYWPEGGVTSDSAGVSYLAVARRSRFQVGFRARLVE